MDEISQAIILEPDLHADIAYAIFLFYVFHFISASLYLVRDCQMSQPSRIRFSRVMRTKYLSLLNDAKNLRIRQ